jgi:polyisoprenoid-binding protein YceI
MLEIVMRNRSCRHRVFLTLLCLSAALTSAEVVKVDPAQSTVTFRGSSTLHDFDGTSTLVAGAFDLSAGAGMIEADATSMKTGSEGRDEKMHGEIMVTPTWPRIRFDLTRFEPVPGSLLSGGTAHGRWTMHGVTREISIPLTFSDVGTPAVRHAKAAFDLDIRRWSIPVPRVVIITVNPVIKVAIDLALVPDATAVVTPAPPRDIVGIAFPDATGAPRGLAAGRPVVVCDTDNYSAAKEWVAKLVAKLPAARQPLVVVMDDVLAEKKRAKWIAKAPSNALFDWTASLRKHLALPSAPIQVIVVDADNRVLGIVDGEVEDAQRDAVLTLMGVPLK